MQNAQQLANAMGSGVIGSRSHSVFHPPSLTCSAVCLPFHARTVSPAQPAACMYLRPDNAMRLALQWQSRAPAHQDSRRGSLVVCSGAAAASIPLPSESSGEPQTSYPWAQSLTFAYRNTCQCEINHTVLFHNQTMNRLSCTGYISYVKMGI